MSDDLSTYMFKVRAMLNEAREQVDQIVKVWQLKITTRVILRTPGPGNQLPETEYIAQGRLRAGWNYWTKAPPGQVPLNGISGLKDGEDAAGATIARLGVELRAASITPISYLWNEVGYGLYVHEGLGNHPYPRPWVQETASEGQELLDQARIEVMGGLHADKA